MNIVCMFVYMYVCIFLRDDGAQQYEALAVGADLLVEAATQVGCQLLDARIRP